MFERLQKILSARGIASRRKAEEYILAGLVKVNGVVALLGQKADPEVDDIQVDGKVIEARKEMLYYVMYKPVGVVTTNIEGNRGNRSNRGLSGSLSSSSSIASISSHSSISSVRDLLPPDLRGRVFPVGRLDKDSEGLLLLTNDGVLAYRLTHPKFDHEKEYEVTVERPMTGGQLDKLHRGMMILGEKTKPAIVKRMADRSFRIALTEGKNRQIRRMCQKVGNPVVSLKRIRIASLSDTRLRAGSVRPLAAQEVRSLLQSVGL